MFFKKDFIPSSQKKIFITLSFTIFITVTGVGIVVPLLPIFAHELGASGLYIGLIFGSFSLSRTILLPIFGGLSDKKGRKPFILAGLLGYAITSLAFIFTTSVESLIIVRFFQGIASAMIMPVVQAYVGEITDKGSEGYSMGLFNMSMFASLSLGPLIGGALKDAFSMDFAFGCMGAFSAMGLFASIFFLPPVNKENVSARVQSPLSLLLLTKNLDIMALILVRLAYTACIGVIWCFVPLFADKAFSLSSTETGFLLMIGIFISGILNLPMGYIADRTNKNLMVIIGGIMCSFAMYLLTISVSYYDLVISVAVFGFGGGIANPALMALAVIKGEQANAMASVISLITVGHSLGMLIGSVAAGIIMDISSLSHVFPCGLILMAAGVLAFIILTSIKKNTPA
ncbi:MAG: MFS transporter [Desulfobacteraceae bacterium]|nr:MFS transporter [Desulfobacteraceae bacterium]